MKTITRLNSDVLPPLMGEGGGKFRNGIAIVRAPIPTFPRQGKVHEAP